MWSQIIFFKRLQKNQSSFELQNVQVFSTIRVELPKLQVRRLVLENILQKEALQQKFKEDIAKDKEQQKDKEKSNESREFQKKKKDKDRCNIENIECKIGYELFIRKHHKHY
ncbi:unnamed protein product [Paramecium sonneborni]|uniref:Uncharacterized protein n=1 Tax=Paramecium sonneborni TaxID=65129 RepID=A0A8S1RE38_9CILI|nr:unnamed protein product [Paramecium sonneborni]